MTDNVKRIKSNLINNADTSFEAAQKEIIFGHPDKAFEIYNKCYVNDVARLHKETKNAGMNSEPAKDTYEIKYKEKCQSYEKELAKLGWTISSPRFQPTKWCWKAACRSQWLSKSY